MVMDAEEGGSDAYPYQFNFVLDWFEEFLALAERER